MSNVNEQIAERSAIFAKVCEIHEVPVIQYIASKRVGVAWNQEKQGLLPPFVHDERTDANRDIEIIKELGDA